MTLRAALQDQAISNATLGSEFTSRVLSLLASHLAPGTPLTDRLFDWPGDITSSGASVPLRLLGGLHALSITATSPHLNAVYPPNPTPDDATLWTAINTALQDHPAFLHRWLDNPPQTNEVRRAVALIAAGHWLTNMFALPIALSELGASAGLNLMWDQFALHIANKTYGPAQPVLDLAPQWRGPLPPYAPPQVVERRGVDISPIDPHQPQGALRLMAYLWPDQPERLTRTQAAIGAAKATVDKEDAADWLESRLSTPRPGCIHLVYHTIAWQYFPEQTQRRCRDALLAAGKAATPNAPLAWLSMEADGGTGAALKLQVWPDARQFDLGRIDFHGRWVDWCAT